MRFNVEERMPYALNTKCNSITGIFATQCLRHSATVQFCALTFCTSAVSSRCVIQQLYSYVHSRSALVSSAVAASFSNCTVCTLTFCTSVVRSVCVIQQLYSLYTYVLHQCRQQCLRHSATVLFCTLTFCTSAVSSRSLN
jgi:hypothetical protein